MALTVSLTGCGTYTHTQLKQLANHTWWDEIEQSLESNPSFYQCFQLSENEAFDQVWEMVFSCLDDELENSPQALTYSEARAIGLFAASCVRERYLVTNMKSLDLSRVSPAIADQCTGYKKEHELSNNL